MFVCVCVFVHFVIHCTHALRSCACRMSADEKCIGDVIDEALGIRGPEDLLKMVLAGVCGAILIVAWFMSRMERWSMNWWSLFGFQVIAVLLCGTVVYVVQIVLPGITNPPEAKFSDKND